jgi:tetratricopeptide (TPR) repeat protein
MSYKDEQRDLKAPDELQKLGATAVPWLEVHGRTVVFGVIGVVVLFGIGAGAVELTSRGEANATTAFGASLKVLSREVNASPTAVTAPGEDPAFKTEAEKNQALIASLTEFRKANAGRKASSSAALPLAQALLREGKAAEALPLVDEYLKAADANDPLRPAAYEARGYAYEEQKQYDQALAAFNQLALANETDFMKGMGLYHRARLLELKGDKQGAAKQFSELQAAAPDSSASRLAKERMSLLAAQGIMAPVVAMAPAAFDAGR